MVPQTNIKPGQHVKCELTGIEGLVSSIGLEENGNIRVGIQPTSQDNKLVDSFFSDQASVTILDDGIAAKGQPFQDTELVIGQHVGDKYSDFVGTISLLVWYLNGCVQAVLVSPDLARGKPIVTALPITRLVAIEPAPEATDERPTGGPITMDYARR